MRSREQREQQMISRDLRLASQKHRTPRFANVPRCSRGHQKFTGLKRMLLADVSLKQHELYHVVITSSRLKSTLLYLNLYICKFSPLVSLPHKMFENLESLQQFPF